MARGVALARGLMALGVLLAGQGGAWSAERQEISLSALHGGQAEAILNGEDAALSLAAVLLPTSALTSVVLSISYENSIDILPEKGGMTLTVNGVPVAELPLSAFKGPVKAAISLPTSLLRPGENRIAFRTQAQHRAICTVRGTFDLWTKVRLAESSLTLLSDGPAPPPDLGMVRHMLVAADRMQEPLTILRTGTALTPDHLGWGALVAQSYGLLLGDHTPVIAAATAPPTLDGASPPGRKNILIGTRDEVAPFLGEARAAAIAGPFLGVYPMGSGGGFVAVVSGRTAAEVDRAVMRLVDADRPLPHQTSVAGDITGDARPAWVDKAVGEGRHTLAELGFASVSHSGYRYTGHVPLRLPVGYAPVADRAMVLRVNAAFEGDLGPGAVLNVRVNGRSASSMEVDKRSSGLIRHGEIPLPMTLFHPGDNVIEVEAESPPASGTDCVFAVRRPTFTLDDSSEIEIPGFARAVTLPDLSTLARTAFPYGPAPGREARPFNLIVMGKDSAWFAAAWTLTARLAQQAGTVLRPIPFTSWEGASGDNALIVGPVAGLPQTAFAGASLAADQLAGLLEAGGLMAQASLAGEPMGAADRRVLVDRLRLSWTGRSGAPPASRPAIPSVATVSPAAIPAENGAQGRWQRLAEAQQGSGASGLVPDWFNRLLTEAIRSVNRWTATEAPVDAATLVEATDALPEAALLQLKAPGSGMAAWTILTASEPRALERAMRTFSDKGLWDSLRGGGALWSSVSPAVSTLPPQQSFQVILSPFDLGNLILILARTLSQRIEILFGLLLGTAALLAVSMRLLLHRGRADRGET